MTSGVGEKLVTEISTTVVSGVAKFVDKPSESSVGAKLFKLSHAREVAPFVSTILLPAPIVDSVVDSADSFVDDVDSSVASAVLLPVPIVDSVVDSVDLFVDDVNSSVASAVLLPVPSIDSVVDHVDLVVKSVDSERRKLESK